MINDDFYAEPTVFDQWQGRLGYWLCTRFGRWCPYAWAAAFVLLALLFAAVAVATLFLSPPGGGAGPTWQQLLAQGVTLVTALAAAQSMFVQAWHAFPGDLPLPAYLRRFVRVRSAAAVARKSVAPSRPPAPVTTRPASRDFLAGVRAAGVNVAIARALVAAGVRSARRLATLSDAELLAIRGVGPATVRKLRRHFDRP